MVVRSPVTAVLAPLSAEPRVREVGHRRRRRAQVLFEIWSFLAEDFSRSIRACFAGRERCVGRWVSKLLLAVHLVSLEVTALGAWPFVAIDVFNSYSRGHQ